MAGHILDRLAVLAAFSSGYFVTGGVFIAVLIILGVVVFPQIRKRYHPSSSAGVAESGSAFDIESLERMRNEGLLTKEEFRKLRLAALGLDTKVSKPENSASSAPGVHDDEESTKRADGPAGSGGTDEEEDGPQEEL